MRSLVWSIYPYLLKWRPVLFKMGDPFLKALATFYHGDRMYCPCCEERFRTFLPFGISGRPNALCPGCLSLERHRLLWLYLRDQTTLFHAPLKVLHVAPEYMFQRLLQQLPNLDYITADLQPGAAMVQMDITDIRYPDQSFDVVICSHVFEHIPDDLRAMKELCRILKPEGWAILQVPIDIDSAVTIEGEPDLSKAERQRRFGHHDHVRMYGRDYSSRLQEAGFDVHIEPYGKEIGSKKCHEYGIMPTEDIYFCKSHISVNQAG